MSREEFNAAVATMRKRLDEEHNELREKMNEFDTWRSNIVGRSIAFTIIGTILVAVSASVITKLILGG